MPIEVKIEAGSRKRFLDLDSDHLALGLRTAEQEAVDFVCVSRHWGYREGHLRFLLDHPKITGLHLYDHPGIDLGAVVARRDFKMLRIADHEGPIDLSEHHHLLELQLPWHRDTKLPSAEGSALRCLSVTSPKPPSADFTWIPPYPHLQDVSAVRGNLTSLRGLERIKALRTVGLAYLPKLSSIAAVSGLSLERLEVHNCPNVTDWHAVAGMKTLKILFADKARSIRSLAFLRDLPALERFVARGTDIEDGDLTPCLGLQDLVLTSNKNFHPPLKEILAQLASRRKE